MIMVIIDQSLTSPIQGMKKKRKTHIWDHKHGGNESTELEALCGSCGTPAAESHMDNTPDEQLEHVKINQRISEK